MLMKLTLEFWEKVIGCKCKPVKLDFGLNSHNYSLMSNLSGLYLFFENKSDKMDAGTYIFKDCTYEYLKPKK